MRTKQIWKFPLQLEDVSKLALPEGAQPLSVGLDPAGTLCLWAIVDPDANPENRIVNVVGTGNPMPTALGAFLGTVRVGPFMLHVFISGPA